MDKELKKYFDVDERREEVRLTIGAEIYLEKVAAEPGEDNSAQVVRCEAMDISANGMQVAVDQELTGGAIHTMVVEIYRSEQVYRLSAEVKWCRKNKHEYHAGLALFDSDGTEIVDWKMTMAKYLN